MIAQIKLLQSACNSYCLTPDPAFLRWFKSQPQYSEEKRYTHFSLDMPFLSSEYRVSKIIFLSYFPVAMRCHVKLKDWETTAQHHRNPARVW